MIVIKDNFLELYSKFKYIKNQGWIKSKRTGSGGIGYTFESLIGKEEDNFSFPDFEGIEIKTTNQFGKEKINLFAATPDGDYLYPINRIIDTLGYPDKDFPEYKVFNMDVNAKEYTKIGYYKMMKLYVNRDLEKIELLVFDRNHNKIDINVSWSFNMIKTKLYVKLRYLAVVLAQVKKTKDSEFFYYNKINLYSLRGFDKFLQLIEEGEITILFKISIFKKGDKLGKTHDRGTVFAIERKSLSKLFYDVIINYDFI